MLHTLRLSLVFCLVFTSHIVSAQQYSDYLGFGHHAGITVQSSHNRNTNYPQNLLTGSNSFTDLNGASRFLRQASLGSNYETISQTSQIGLNTWIDDQFALTPGSFATEYQRIYSEADSLITGNVDVLKARNDFLSYTFYEMAIKKPDVLRQKIAFALSQIFVISPYNTRLTNKGFVNASYYDILYQKGFGNFRDLLYDVTMHPAMGIYLSHFQNEKADIIQESYPDENYAREIMQLFTIGLLELNPDGSFKLDQNGKTIPTYDNDDIQELSKVFTGLSGSVSKSGTPPQFKSSPFLYDLTYPMRVYENYHDKTEKVMIDGSIVPANQSGIEDINAAIDVLFNHENVGPFIGLRLIQHLVKSNPSPQYIKRITALFNDNGFGVRGDLKAVIKGILLDPEARNCEWINEQTAGKLVQPLERISNLLFAFDVQTPSGNYWFRDKVELSEDVQQSFLSATSVFNFFTPFFAENDFVAPNNLVSPEFQILNSTSGIYNLNLIEDALKKQPFLNWTRQSQNMTGLAINGEDKPVLDFTDEINLYNPTDNNTIDQLLNRLDIILCSGQLKSSTKRVIKNTIIQNKSDDNRYDARDAINDAVYYIMISPDYLILK